MSWEHIKHLRTEATRGLKQNRGGASPRMRLGVLAPPVTDPGFYQFWQTLLTFRHIAQKQKGFADLWCIFMSKYRGKASYGPFGKLLEVCAQVGWSIEAPRLIDHDAINMLKTDSKHLEILDIDVWRQAVAVANSLPQRKDVVKLKGIDWRVIHAVFGSMPHHRRQALQVLQDGAFVEKQIHKRYDLTQAGKCKQLCGQLDSTEHRCRECPARQHVYHKHAGILQRWDDMTKSMKCRLLPSRNPFEAEFKRLLFQATDTKIGLRHLQPRGHLDVFTDGSCRDPQLPWASMGAWAIIQVHT